MITPKTPEELKMLIEPFPFLSQDEKDLVVESAQNMFDFNDYIAQKYSSVSDEIRSQRLQLQLAAKMAQKSIKYNASNFEGEISEAEIFGEAWEDIAKDEGFDKSIKAAATALIGLETTIEKNIMKMVEEGREEELEKWVEMMEKMEKK